MNQECGKDVFENLVKNFDNKLKSQFLLLLNFFCNLNNCSLVNMKFEVILFINYNLYYLYIISYNKFILRAPLFTETPDTVAS